MYISIVEEGIQNNLISLLYYRLVPKLILSTIILSSLDSYWSGGFGVFSIGILAHMHRPLSVLEALE